MVFQQRTAGAQSYIVCPLKSISRQAGIFPLGKPPEIFSVNGQICHRLLGRQYQIGPQEDFLILRCAVSSLNVCKIPVAVVYIQLADMGRIDRVRVGGIAAHLNQAALFRYRLRILRSLIHTQEVSGIISVHLSSLGGILALMQILFLVCRIQLRIHIQTESAGNGIFHRIIRDNHPGNLVHTDIPGSGTRHFNLHIGIQRYTSGRSQLMPNGRLRPGPAGSFGNILHLLPDILTLLTVRIIHMDLQMLCQLLIVAVLIIKLTVTRQAPVTRADSLHTIADHYNGIICIVLVQVGRIVVLQGLVLGRTVQGQVIHQIHGAGASLEERSLAQIHMDHIRASVSGRRRSSCHHLLRIVRKHLGITPGRRNAETVGRVMSIPILLFRSLFVPVLIPVVPILLLVNIWICGLCIERIPVLVISLHLGERQSVLNYRSFIRIQPCIQFLCSVVIADRIFLLISQPVIGSLCLPVLLIMEILIVISVQALQIYKGMTEILLPADAVLVIAGPVGII